jgi:hypothetical protein
MGFWLFKETWSDNDFKQFCVILIAFFAIWFYIAFLSPFPKYVCEEIWNRDWKLIYENGVDTGVRYCEKGHIEVRDG